MSAPRKVFALRHGDCVESLKVYPDNSIDSVVTDPPYELGFMGKSWDASGIAYSVELWREVLRVLKPGGHMLAFGGTRTYHRMACAIEDAGFEVRDSLHWIYGTGFPKSVDIGKELDKRAGATREVVGARPYTNAKMSAGQGVSGLHQAGGHAGDYEGERINVPITAPATDLAKQWDGWGSALKPAHEPIVMARKPLIGTLAANVTAHGTGGLNIDGCRISTEGEVIHAPQSDPSKRAGAVGSDLGISSADVEKFQAAQRASIERTKTLGRWPANVLFDEDAAAELDAQSGTLKSGAIADHHKRTTSKTKNTFGERAANKEIPREASEGGASRFFYVAKPSRSERDRGCEHLPARTGGEATDRADDSAGVDNPRTGAGRTGGKKREALNVEFTWDNEVRSAVLLVDMVASPPKVISASGALGIDASEWSTLLFGSPRTGPSLPDMTSTIETKTNSTTASKTWNWFRASLTSVFTRAVSSTTADAGKSLAASAEPFGMLLNITDAKMASRLGANLAASPMQLRISGSGTLIAEGIKNHHCTVKPIQLMRYLCRLVTPPGGIVLDPFTGSGTTGIAALEEGFRFIGIERDPEYIVIARTRIGAVRNSGEGAA